MKYATTEQHAQARDEISEAVAQIKRQQQLGATSRARSSSCSRPAVPRRRSKVDGEDVTLPAIPKLGADFVRAAANLVFDGTLSRGDVKRLHDRRLKVKSLGYKTRSAKPAPKQGVPNALAGLAQTTGRAKLKPVK